MYLCSLFHARTASQSAIISHYAYYLCQSLTSLKLSFDSVAVQVIEQLGGRTSRGRRRSSCSAPPNPEGQVIVIYQHLQLERRGYGIQ